MTGVPRFLTQDNAFDTDERWQLVIPEGLWDRMDAHLFPGDDDEHGAVIAAGVVRTSRGTRLLARSLFLAEDGVDFVPSQRGSRRLTAEFVNTHIRYCRDERLIYLAVHNHGGRATVGFSDVDFESHERGYPALLDIAKGQPVGALVVARDALAGDLWDADGTRHRIGETVVVGTNLRRVYPKPAAASSEQSYIDDRQVRIYGHAGQALVGRQKIGVIGVGGVGLPVVSALARLGVGHLVLVDPDRVAPTNLPRMPESTRWDAKTLLDHPGRPAFVRRLGQRFATPKVKLGRRVAQRARPDISVTTIRADVPNRDVVRQLIDCDYLFLAADTDLARLIFNLICHQYLVPGVQIGSKISVSNQSEIIDIFSVVRPVTSERGCLACNGLIDPTEAALQAKSPDLRAAQRYVPETDAPAPSVGTLNAIGAAHATNSLLLMLTGLRVADPRDPESIHCYRHFSARGETMRLDEPRHDQTCIDCGEHSSSARGRGDNWPFPATS